MGFVTLRQVVVGRFVVEPHRQNLQDAPEPHWHVLEPRLQPQAQAAHRYLTGPEAPDQPRGER